MQSPSAIALQSTVLPLLSLPLGASQGGKLRSFVRIEEPLILVLPLPLARWMDTRRLGRSGRLRRKSKNFLWAHFEGIKAYSLLCWYKTAGAVSVLMCRE